MRLNFIFSFSPGPPLGLRGLAALLIVVTMLANGGQANSFPDYPYAELTVEEKGSLTSWGVIGQFTAWCMCQQVGRVSPVVSSRKHRRFKVVPFALFSRPHQAPSRLFFISHFLRFSAFSPCISCSLNSISASQIAA